MRRHVCELAQVSVRALQLSDELNLKLMRRIRKASAAAAGDSWVDHAADAVIDRMLDGEVPAIVHCAAGKDRTGWVVAVLLLAIGVPLETVERDYMLTDRFHGREELTEMARIALRAPAALARFIAPKGSVALDGVALTVNEVAGDTFSVLIIPHTLKVTTLGALAAGDHVNLEVDLMARYAARLMARCTR